jgi:hypothetical protein
VSSWMSPWRSLGGECPSDSILYVSRNMVLIFIFVYGFWSSRNERVLVDTKNSLMGVLLP